MLKEPFKGLFATPQTPFSEDGDVHIQDLRKEVNFCLEAGVHGIVALVMSAEFSTLSIEERKKIAEIIIEETNHSVPVVIGTSGVSTNIAVELSIHAERKGADAIIVMPPYVRKESSIGIYKYYKKISDAINIPIIVQNFSSPMGSNLSSSFLAKLATEIDNIDYIKEERIPSPHHISDVIESCGHKVKGVFGGCAGRWMFTEFERGACGWITACEICDVLVEVYENLKFGNKKIALEKFNSVINLIDMELLYGVSVAKEILKRRGIISSTYTRVSSYKNLDELDLQELDRILLKLGLKYK